MGPGLTAGTLFFFSVRDLSMLIYETERLSKEKEVLYELEFEL